MFREAGLRILQQGIQGFMVFGFGEVRAQISMHLLEQVTATWSGIQVVLQGAKVL